MRTREERESLFVQAAKKSVRKCFSKRALAKRAFSGEEMKEIREIDAFLRKVSMSQMDPLEKQFLGRNYYFCVAVRVKGKILGEEYEIFIHHFIKEKDFDYGKVEYYIAKGIYLANQNKHFEVYYCVNLLRPRYEEGGICMPRRAMRNMTSASCIFCDLDLEEPYASMDDETLLATFQKEKGELISLLNPILVRSGRGMHLYVLLDESMDLTMEDVRAYWKDLSTTLAYLLRDYNADYKVVDCARILRCVHSVNRKEKYGAQGKKVTLLRDSNERICVEELDCKLDFLMQGGAGTLFERILDDIIHDDDEARTSYDFYPIEFEDDFFCDEVRPYEPPEYIVNALRYLKDKEAETQPEIEEKEWIGKEELKSTRAFPSWKPQKKQGTYQGIMVSYENLPKVMWQNRDLLFWISNRSSIEGHRNSLIFFLAFNTYYFEKVRSENAIYERLHYYNEKFFCPKLSEKELKLHVSICYKKFEKNIRTRHIRNETIQRFFPFEEEEKAYTIGNYYETDSESFIEKNRKKQREQSLNYYYEKKRDNEKLDYFQALEKERKKECYEYIKKNPFDTYENARKSINIGKRQYYDLRKEIQKELGVYVDKQDFYEPFKTNINIKYQEYNAIFPCTRCTFHRRKKRYLKS